MSVIDLAASPSDLRALAEQSNAWPFEQAKAIVARLKKNPKDEVLFETGYGPSGLPHIGTFNEVLRTTMVWRVVLSRRTKPISRHTASSLRRALQSRSDSRATYVAARSMSRWWRAVVRELLMWCSR